MKREESNISLISDIVKKKRITFLKSASLFADEDEIFASPTNAKHKSSPEPTSFSQNYSTAKHRKLIRRHLDDKKKLEGAIEKMQIGGDK